MGLARKSACSAGSAGNKYVAVAPDGLIYPCHQFMGNKDFVLGDLKAWDGEGKLPLNQEIRSLLQNSNIHTKAKCRNCFAKYYYSGGCAANNYNLNGDVVKPVDVMCVIIKKRVECALAVNIIERT